jgi:predicted XRE-type DNA-binding protein
MNTTKTFSNVWDALEDDPIRARNLKLRSELMILISQELDARQLTQSAAAELLQITQPRVCALLQGKIENFRLDSLVDMAHRLKLEITLGVAA